MKQQQPQWLVQSAGRILATSSEWDGNATTKVVGVTSSEEFYSLFMSVRMRVCMSVMDFSCLATWKDSRSNFVVGRVTSQSVADDKNSIYRCIVSNDYSYDYDPH